MADEQVRIDVIAEDKASKVLDAVADKVEDLEAAKVDIPVEADTKPAERDVGDLLKKVEKLAADPATILLTSNATQIAGDMAALILDLDALDAADPTVDVKVDQLNKLQGDLEQIEAKVRDLNGTPVDVDTRPAVAGIDDVGRSAGSSKSVLANMVGNSAQDIGELGGIAGSAGVAFGQMGEYMADARAEGEGMGSIFKSFAGVAGPVAGLALATKVLGDVVSRFGESTKRTTDDVEAWSDALTEGGDAASNYAEHLKDVGSVTLDVTRSQSGLENVVSELNSHWYTTGAGVAILSKWLGVANEETRDLTPVLAAAGLNADQFARFATAGADGVRKLGEVLAGTSLSAKDQEAVLSLLGQRQADYATATATSAAVTKVFGDNTNQAAEHAKALNAAYDDAGSAQSWVSIQEEAGDQLDRVNRLLLDQAAALEEQVDAATTAADAQLAENDALTAYSDALHDADVSSNDTRDAAIALAKAHVETADAQARASGQTLTATQRLDIQNDALLRTAATAKGPTRDGILAYIGSVNQIPPEKVSEIRALIAQGKLQEAKDALNGASSTRTAAIQAEATNVAATDAAIDAIANQRRVAMIEARLNPNYGASLGPINGGPRSVVPPEGAAPPVVEQVNVTQYLPRGWRGDALTEARRAARRSGGMYQRARR